MVASFPTSIKVFTTKADGETIYGSHMNDVQDEVAAIQTILGTAPQGAAATVKARIAALETGKADTSHNHDHNTLSNLTVGDPHTQYLLKSVVTAKGDILAATGNGAISRVAVGTNGQRLVADSAQAAGVKWEASTEVPNSAYSAKGVIVAGTGANTYAARTVGANGRVLVADSAQATGLNWSASDPFLVGEYTAKGQIPVGTAAGAKAQVAVGTNKQMLLADSAQAAGVRWGADPTLAGYSEAVVTNGAATGTVTIDASTVNVANLTLTGATTLAFSNVPAGVAYSIMLVLRQDATGGRVTTFPAGTKWQNGSPPSLSTAASAINIVSLVTVNGGGEWFAFLSGKGMA